LKTKETNKQKDEIERKQIKQMTPPSGKKKQANKIRILSKTIV